MGNCTHGIAGVQDGFEVVSFSPILGQCRSLLWLLGAPPSRIQSRDCTGVALLGSGARRDCTDSEFVSVGESTRLSWRM